MCYLSGCSLCYLVKVLAILKHGNSIAVREAVARKLNDANPPPPHSQQYSKIVPKRKSEQIEAMECDIPLPSRCLVGSRKSSRLEGKPRVVYDEPTEEGNFFTAQEISTAPTVHDWMLLTK